MYIANIKSRSEKDDYGYVFILFHLFIFYSDIKQLLIQFSAILLVSLHLYFIMIK